tara:strand:+ start:555 stop:791 length:237 start_codon:yes stop_codon:yes gene_type:complete
MTSVVDMAEAHLINVQREVQQLVKRKEDIQAEIDRLTQYLGEATGVVETAKSEAQAALAGSATSTSSEKEFPFQSVTG